MRWTSHLEQLACVMKHKSGASNHICGALSKLETLLMTLKVENVKFNFLKGSYEEDEDLKKFGKSIYQNTV